MTAAKLAAATEGMPREKIEPSASSTVKFSLGRLDDRLRDAHAALEIVDFLIEKGASHLAYRATNPVFSAIREMLDIVEAASAAERELAA